VTDPYEFVCDALALLPADAASCTQADLPVLAAAAQGLAQIIAHDKREMAALARVATGTPDDAVLAERARLEARYQRGTFAHNRLARYTAAALQACGIDPAELLGGRKETNQP